MLTGGFTTTKWPDTGFVAFLFFFMVAVVDNCVLMCGFWVENSVLFHCCCALLYGRGDDHSLGMLKFSDTSRTFRASLRDVAVTCR